MSRSRLLRAFTESRRVIYTNRRKRLPRGMTMGDLAEEHAAAIRALRAGPVDVAGISTGGSIAQQLAADHPELVDRLVLVSTACRLSPHGRALQRRVAARRGPCRRWREPRPTSTCSRDAWRARSAPRRTGAGAAVGGRASRRRG